MNDLKADFLNWIRSADARAAFEYMVNHGSRLSGYQCSLVMEGSKRVYLYKQATERPFAFIVNQKNLLFYFRKAGISHPAADKSALSRRFADVKYNNSGELRLRVESEQDAKDLLIRIFGGNSEVSNLPELGAYESELSEQISRSVQDSRAGRRSRLRRASDIPERILVQTYIFRRNPDVIAEVLLRANGTCEACRKPAPFRRSRDGSWYLEVHHKIQLRHGGRDNVENAVALCANCHRRSHYGNVQEWRQLT